MSTSPDWSALQDAKYVRLTTFRRDGTPVPTPVWVVRDGDRILVTTTASTGKVKRLRHTPRVLLAESDMRGRVAPGTPEVEGVAAVSEDPARIASLGRAVVAKYGLLARLIHLGERVRRRTDGVCLEIAEA